VVRVTAVMEVTAAAVTGVVACNGGESVTEVVVRVLVLVLRTLRRLFAICSRSARDRAGD
jgi:hypothetical protein